MTFNKGKIEKALRSKGFELDNTHHRYLIYHSRNGKKTPVRTRLSHGPSGKDIDSSLVSRMAKQCRLNNRDFENLINCPLDQNSYENRLRNSGEI